MTSFNFAEALLAWFDHHGRHDLPWQTPDDPYRVWLSEIMLQQTQVKTVIPYFERFLQAFPTLESLAEAKIDQVLAAWTGLGYYARARNLHRTAVIIHQDLGGKFPDNQVAWAELPGVGPSTAAAITSICFNERVAILDGNVKRVLTRFFAEPGWPGASRVANKLWAQAESLLPDARFGDYTQAIMDLGATVCSRKQPQCHRCPVSEACVAHHTGEQDAFPASKPKKHRPSKSIWMLIAATEEGDYFVEKRPNQGIWGGLHSFPEFASLDALLQWIQADANRVELTPFKHQFTHYELVIHPVLVRKAAWPALTSAYEGQWINDLEHLNIGLSKPAVTLLQQLTLVPD